MSNAPKKKPKKRFHSVQQILAEIDRYKAMMQKHNDAANALELKASMMIRDDTSTIGEIHYAQREADRYRRAAARIQEKRLPKLKQKLAEIQTPQIPAIDNGDKNISAQ